MSGKSHQSATRRRLALQSLPMIGDILSDLFPGDAPARRHLERLDRPRRLRARSYVLATALTGAVYLIWLLFAVDTRHPFMAIGFLLAETTALALFVLAATNFWDIRYKHGAPLKLDRRYSVDVFVTAYKKPPEVAARTLRACADIRWDGPLTVYVLDDGARFQLRRLCDELGFEYHSRSLAKVSRDDAKAGNLNFGLEQSDGDLILVLDSDQVPEPRIVRVLAGYMRFPDVAFVQSKQSFLVPDDDPFESADRVFYEAAQLGLDADDAVISCGSGVLYRREALEEIGGFATWNVVEDLTTSYELHARGWKSFYVPHRLSRGLAPADVWDVYQQRGQWALDTMRLFIWDNPLFKKGASWSVRRDYLVVGLTYLLSGFALPFFFLVPVWTYLTGDAVLVRPPWEFVLTRSVYFLAMVLAIYYTFRRKGTARQFKLTLAGLFPVYAWQTLRALFYPPGRKPDYRSNGAERSWSFRGPALWAVTPQLLLLLANATLPFWALYHGTAGPWIVLANAMVSAFAIWCLWPVVSAAVRKKRWRSRVSPDSFYGTDAARQPAAAA